MTNQEYRNLLEKQWEDLIRQRGQKSRKIIQEEGARAFAKLLHLGYDEALLIPTMVQQPVPGQMVMAYQGSWDNRTFLLFTGKKHAGFYAMNYGEFDIRTMIQNMYYKPQIKRLTINPEDTSGISITITRELLFSLSEGRIYPKPKGFVPARPY